MGEEGRLKIDRVQLMGFLAEAYAGSGDHLKALALGGEAGKSWFFLGRNYFNEFPFQLLLMAILAGSGLGAFVWSYRNFDDLIDRCSFPTLKEMVSLLKTGYSGEITQAEDRLMALVMRLRSPWFSYLTGLVLLHHGKFDVVPHHFQAAIGSPAIAPRAYFFLGLARQAMQQSLGDHDFEQAFFAGMREPKLAWLPDFLRDLENTLVEKYMKCGPDLEKDLGPMAWKALQNKDQGQSGG